MKLNYSHQTKTIQSRIINLVDFIVLQNVKTLSASIDNS